MCHLFKSFLKNSVYEIVSDNSLSKKYDYQLKSKKQYDIVILNAESQLSCYGSPMTLMIRNNYDTASATKLKVPTCNHNQQNQQ